MEGFKCLSLFFPRSGSIPFYNKGETMHFFLDLQEKSSKKEVGELAVRSLFATDNCHAWAFCSRTCGAFGFGYTYTRK